MQKIIISVVVLCSAATCFAATAIGPAQIQEGHPNRCYETEKNAYYSPGESWQLENCGLATCTLNNYTGTPQLMVAYESCGTVSVDPPCYLTEDHTAAYPECCPQPVCPEGAEQEQESESTEVENGRQVQSSDDSENEIEDNADVYRYSEVKEDRASNELAEKPKTQKTQTQEEYNEAENMIGDEDEAYLGSNFYQNSLEDLQYLDFLPERENRKVSPRFQYLDNPYPSSYSYYQWF